ncbi:MAG: hypothetical protein ACYS8X_04210 [Planctomycetota bacterium]|jgi:hypothetical protein
MIDVTIEQVAVEVGAATIHGWNTGRLVKTGGALYFAANKIMPDDADPEDWRVQNTLMFRRDLSADGKWELAADIEPRTYTCCVDNRGRFWSISPKHFNYITLWRSEPDMGLDELTRCYDGTCAYLGMGVDRKTGNHLLVHTEDCNHMPRCPNPMICVFYDAETDSWRKSSIPMPEGRFGYVGILVRGRKAVILMQSTQLDPVVEPNEPHYNWRLLKLARCDDLMEGNWVTQPLAMRKFGQTNPSDMVEMPDGKILVAYKHRGGDESYEATQETPFAFTVSVVSPDLSFETFRPAIDIEPGGRFFLGSDSRWYLVGRPTGGEALRLWRIDVDNGFEPTADWDLPGTEVLKGGPMHTLRPDRFGGEDDGDTIHIATSDAPGVSFDDPRNSFGIVHARFELPVNE